MVIHNFRRFDATDPFERNWAVAFQWHQNGISIRHADTVDVKFHVTCGDELLEKVIALPHAALLQVSQQAGRQVSDAWCIQLAALHMKHMIETWEDMDKGLTTISTSDLERHNRTLSEMLAEQSAMV